MSSKELESRKIILDKYMENPTWSFSLIARTLKKPASTVRYVIKRFRDQGSVERKPGSGGNRVPCNQKFIARILRDIKKNPCQSVRDLAKKFDIPKSNIQRIRKKYKLKSFKALRIPDRCEKQLLTARRRSRKLYYEKLVKMQGCLIMDEETYVKSDFKQMPGNQYYSSVIRGDVPNKFKVIKMGKYTNKYLIWQAICTCGRKSAIYIARETINSDIYIKECLEKKLLLFIRSHSTTTLFWPDLASCHYSRKTIEWYKASNIHFVPKELNSPNCPELRLIEQYWALVKRNLRMHGRPATCEANFKIKWTKSSNLVSRSVVQRLMGNVKRKVRAFNRDRNL